MKASFRGEGGGIKRMAVPWSKRKGDNAWSLCEGEDLLQQRGD